MHGSHVNEQRAFDAATSTLAHASPVLERVTDQCVGRNGGDGLVEVLYFYGSQWHFNHITVGTVFGHGNPVARTKHVVGRKLHTGHQSQNAVLENQHQYGGWGPQAGQDGGCVPVNQDADDKNKAYSDGNQVYHLVDAFERTVLEGLMLAGDFIEGVQEAFD